MRAFQLSFGAIITIGASSALCGSLSAPFSLDSAAVMPKGVRNVRITGFTTQVFDKYNGSGSVVPLANSFNKPVTWKELIDSRPSEFERGQLKGGLRAEGVALEDVAGQAHGLVNSRLSVTAPVVAYGLTEKITLGVGVPIVYSSTNVDTGWSVSELGQNQINMLMARGYENKIMNVRQALNDVVATKISSYGYKPLTNEEHTDMGDVSLGAKWQFFADETFTFALAPKVTLPTGRVADIDKVVDIAPGDGQIDTGIAVVGDVAATSKLTLTGSAGYTHQWESTKAKRIPRSSAESISPDVDRSVREKLGDLMGLGASTKYKINDLFVTGLGYSLQYKNQDEYSGGGYAAERYRHLETDTWQNLQAAQLSLTATTVQLYKTGKFAVPLDATVSFTRVLEGRNVSKVDLAVFEFAAYF